MDSVGWAPGEEIQVSRPRPNLYMMGALPFRFGRNTWYDVREEVFYVATNDTYEIKVYSSAGILQALIRKEQDNAPVTGQVIARMRRLQDQWFASRDWSKPFRESIEGVPFPETMPAFGRTLSAQRPFLVDTGGNLWVLEYNEPGDDRNRWTVFDASGVLLGTLNAPDGLDIMEVGDDYVLGLWRDGLDVQHVKLHALIKPDR